MFVPSVCTRATAFAVWPRLSFSPIALTASATDFAATWAFISTGFSNFIGVVVTLPFTSTVAVHSNRNGNLAGLVYLIVTAPVVASLESVKSTGLCSDENTP